VLGEGNHEPGTKEQAAAVLKKGDLTEQMEQQQLAFGAEQQALSEKAEKKSTMMAEEKSAKKAQVVDEAQKSEEHEAKLELKQARFGEAKQERRLEAAKRLHGRLLAHHNKLKAELLIPMELSRLQMLVKLYQEKLHGLHKLFHTIQPPGMPLHSEALVRPLNQSKIFILPHHNTAKLSDHQISNWKTLYEKGKKKATTPTQQVLGENLDRPMQKEHIDSSNTATHTDAQRLASQYGTELDRLLKHISQHEQQHHRNGDGHL